MATTRKRSTTTRRRTSTSSRSALDDILGGITGTSTRRRSRKPTVGGITGGKASSSIFLTLAAICFAVGYYVEGFEWLIYIGLGLAVIYLIVAYFKNRKKTAAPKEPSGVSKSSGRSSTPGTPTSLDEEEAVAESRLSESQRAQVLDRLHTLPELQQLHPRFGDAAKLVVHQRAASAESLTSLLKLSADEAATILRQLELVGIIGAAQPTGQHSVYVTSEDELSEWLKLIMEA